MLLDQTTPREGPPSPTGRFLYAQVLGAYHANVMYNGPGAPDFKPRRFDFLWVRWYRVIRPGNFARDEMPLVSFYPIRSEHAFGFVNPDEVLRACHIIPRFAEQPLHFHDHGMSRCAQDHDDYPTYYVGW